MAYANIILKNPSPKPHDNSIPLNTIFSFDLVPFNGAEIDLSTLSIKVYLSGGLMNVTQIFTFTSTSPQVTYTGSSTVGYSFKIDVFPNSSPKLESQQGVEIRVAVKDTSGNDMHTVQLTYSALNLEQYEAISDLLSEVMEIPVYDEQGRINIDGTQVNWTHRPWSLVRDATIYKNDIIIDTGYTVNKNSGLITFSSPIRYADPVDIIKADYFFSLFTEKEILRFMKNAMSVYNGWRPQTEYNLKNAPVYAQAAILLGAATFAMENILLGLAAKQQTRVIFGDDWKDAQSGITTLKENYKAQWEKMLEEKRFKLASSKSIVIPEYTLPGGRSRFFRNLYKEGAGI